MFFVNDARGSDKLEKSLAAAFPHLRLLRLFNSMAVACNLAVGQHSFLAARGFWRNRVRSRNKHISLSPHGENLLACVYLYRSPAYLFLLGPAKKDSFLPGKAFVLAA